MLQDVHVAVDESGDDDAVLEINDLCVDVRWDLVEWTDVGDFIILNHHRVDEVVICVTRGPRHKNAPVVKNGRHNESLFFVSIGYGSRVGSSHDIHERAGGASELAGAWRMDLPIWSLGGD